MMYSPKAAQTQTYSELPVGSGEGLSSAAIFVVSFLWRGKWMKAPINGRITQLGSGHMSSVVSSRTFLTRVTLPHLPASVSIVLVLFWILWIWLEAWGIVFTLFPITSIFQKYRRRQKSSCNPWGARAWRVASCWLYTWGSDAAPLLTSPLNPSNSRANYLMTKQQPPTSNLWCAYLT